MFSCFLVIPGARFCSVTAVSHSTLCSYKTWTARHGSPSSVPSQAEGEAQKRVRHETKDAPFVNAAQEQAVSSKSRPDFSLLSN